jgi:hypothetical protein
MNFDPSIFRGELSARKQFFFLQNRITLALIFISHRTEKSMLPMNTEVAKAIKKTVPLQSIHLG